MVTRKTRLISALAALVLLLTTFGPSAHTQAQGASRTFPETGKTVSGRFLDYWTTHGGLAQQGYPISEQISEVSDTNGKTYQVQYFERAVFEAHPEFAPPNDVLLSLLGVFLYGQKYPGGAPSQVVNSEPGAHLFTETGHTAGGLFLKYWTEHGGLAQQGYPISDEFNEVSALNGQTYKVQYFERSVFEFHPENAAPYNVLLSQLGTYRYGDKYLKPKPTNTPPPPAATPTTAAPTNTPAPTDTPRPACDTSGNRNGRATPEVVRAGGTVSFTATGFQQGRPISYWFTTPSGIVVGTPRAVNLPVNPDGSLGPLPLDIDPVLPQLFGFGRWAITFQQGDPAINTAIIYFCIVQQ